MPTPYAVRKAADIRGMVQRSTTLMQRIQTRLLPRARQRVNASDDLLNQSTGQELSSTQRILDSDDERPAAAVKRV